MDITSDTEGGSCGSADPSVFSEFVMQRGLNLFEYISTVDMAALAQPKSSNFNPIFVFDEFTAALVQGLVEVGDFHAQNGDTGHWVPLTFTAEQGGIAYQLHFHDYVEEAKWAKDVYNFDDLTKGNVNVYTFNDEKQEWGFHGTIYLYTKEGGFSKLDKFEKGQISKNPKYCRLQPQFANAIKELIFNAMKQNVGPSNATLGDIVQNKLDQGKVKANEGKEDKLDQSSSSSSSNVKGKAWGSGVTPAKVFEAPATAPPKAPPKASTKAPSPETMNQWPSLSDSGKTKAVGKGKKQEK